MAKKEDLGEQLKARENRRKSSVVSSMIGASAIQAPAEEPQVGGDHTDPELKKEVTHDLKKGTPEWDLQKSERKTQRKQILLYPSVHDRAMEKCKKTGISLNHAINELLGRWADTE